MYEYKFVNAQIGGLFSTDNHQEIIDQYSKEGWRLVQVLNVDYSLEGRPRGYEIIFERKITE